MIPTMRVTVIGRVEEGREAEVGGSSPPCGGEGGEGRG